MILSATLTPYCLNRVQGVLPFRHKPPHRYHSSVDCLASPEVMVAAWLKFDFKQLQKRFGDVG